MQIALILIIALHLVCVLTAAGAPLLAFVLHGRKMQRKIPLSSKAGSTLILWSIGALWLGTFLGLLIGWLKWDEMFSGKLNVLSNKVFYLVIEWLFSMALLSWMYWWWKKRESVEGWKHVVRSLLPILASLNLLHHFPVFFSALRNVTEEMVKGGRQITGEQFNELAFQSAGISKTLHIAMSAIMISGAMLALICTRAYVLSGTVKDDWSKLTQWAARTTFVTMLIVVPTGVWAIVSMNTGRMDALMGDDSTATACFGIAMCLVLAQMHQWSQIAFGKVEVRKIAQAVTTLITTIILMTAMSQLT